MKLRDIMTNQISAVKPDSSVSDVASAMRDHNIGSVPVCQGKKPVGIVTDRDITIRNVADGRNANARAQDVMSKDLVCGTPDMDAQKAAEIMGANQIRRLPIVENEEIVGMVALGDLAVSNKLEMEAGNALTYISTPSKPTE
ncbi:CBS domain-containing protein [Halobacteroides halobius DSM 5150]|uniref:CBS domain-containing protein n=1 Tax=Halobacteroides halobius (strain ATCC 35273 / DSM 5150 / MD-1) TaxID=748449 RepID=L0K7L6_HALHC|nr:CBS domain-containing protein [Halobacteroides halobius]AGB40329.1 CBS domain-containing protein [Halobacteroides halobius DSM 5150]